MPKSEDVWAGIGGGLNGLYEGLQAMQQRKTDQQRFDAEQATKAEEIAMRRQQLIGELDGMVRRLAQGDEEIGLKKQEAADRRAANEAESQRRSAFLNSLPVHLRRAAEAEDLGYRFGPEQFAPPKTPAQEEADRQGNLRNIEDEAFARARGGRRGAPLKSATPLTLKDDPALPTGVKRYLAGFAARYAGNPQGAHHEFQQALPDLYRDHPQLDTQKAVAMLNAIFPQRRASDSLYEDIAAGGRPAPPAAPLRTAGAPAPATAPRPVGATPITLPQSSSGPSIKQLEDRRPGHQSPAASLRGVQVGATVRLRDGRRVKVAGINADGSIEIEPLR